MNKHCDFCAKPLVGTPEPLHLTVVVVVGRRGSVLRAIGRTACDSACALGALEDLNAAAVTSRRAMEALLVKRNADLSARLAELEAAVTELSTRH